jgi:hypothetical protein
MFIWHFVCEKQYDQLTTFHSRNETVETTFVDERDRGTAPGRYTFDPAAKCLSVQYEGLAGPGSGGGWHNESFRVELDQTQFDDLVKGGQVTTIMRSQRWYNAPMSVCITSVMVDLQSMIDAKPGYGKFN